MLKPNKRSSRKYQDIARKIHTSMSSRGMRKSSSPNRFFQKQLLNDDIERKIENNIEESKVCDPLVNNEVKEESIPKSSILKSKLAHHNKSMTISHPNLSCINPLFMDTKKALRSKKLNFMVRNTEDFLREEDIDIHGLSNLSEHKVVRFKYPRSKPF